jgi:hypothetical protein
VTYRHPDAVSAGAAPESYFVFNVNFQSGTVTIVGSNFYKKGK